jgi:hypothetical protein
MTIPKSGTLFKAKLDHYLNVTAYDDDFVYRNEIIMFISFSPKKGWIFLTAKSPNIKFLSCGDFFDDHDDETPEQYLNRYITDWVTKINK